MADETEIETVVRLHATDVRELYPCFSPEDAGSRVCVLCAMRLKDKTHNLTRHLERHHPAALLQLLEQRGQASPSSTPRRATAPRKHRPVITAASSPRHADEDADWGVRAAAANRALAKWLAQEQLPLGLVDGAQFRVFVQALNSRFQPSTRDDLPGLLGSLAASQDAEDEQLAGNPTAAMDVLQSRVLRATSRAADDVPVVQYQTVASRGLQRGEARVRVLCTAASLVDALVCRGRVLGRNGVLGRALVGVVTHLQLDATNIWEDDPAVHVNDKVVASPFLPCAVCRQREPDAAELWCPHEAQCLGVNAPIGAMAEYVTLPVANLLVVPASVPDELLLLADDASVAVAVGNELTARQIRSVAVLTDARSGCLARVIALYLHHALDLPLTSIRLVADRSARSPAVERVDLSSASVDGRWRHAAFDATVDLLGGEQAIAWAIRATRPLGCVLLVDRARFSSTASQSTSVAVDVNVVVVNELDVVGVQDCRAEMPQAVAYLARQANNPPVAAQLRALVSDRAVAFSAALQTLARAPEAALEAQYLVVDMSRSDAK